MAQSRQQKEVQQALKIKALLKEISDLKKRLKAAQKKGLSATAAARFAPLPKGVSFGCEAYVKRRGAGYGRCSNWAKSLVATGRFCRVHTEAAVVGTVLLHDSPEVREDLKKYSFGVRYSEKLPLKVCSNTPPEVMDEVRDFNPAAQALSDKAQWFASKKAEEVATSGDGHGGLGEATRPPPPAI